MGLPWLDQLIRDFFTLFTVIDPIGSVPVFLAVTRGLSGAERRLVAIRAILIASGVLVFFAWGGQVLLETLDIPLPAFRIAGGIILFLVALDMLFGESKPEAEVAQVAKLSAREAGRLAVFPLAIPSIAGPGAMMAAVLLTDSHRTSITEQLITTGVMLLVLAGTLLLLLGAGAVHRLIGDVGASIVSRVMGMIIAAIAVTGVLEGLRAYFPAMTG